MIWSTWTEGDKRWQEDRSLEGQQRYMYHFSSATTILFFLNKAETCMMGIFAANCTQTAPKSRDSSRLDQCLRGSAWCQVDDHPDPGPRTFSSGEETVSLTQE
jgi:hypothetical protein